MESQSIILESKSSEDIEGDPFELPSNAIFTPRETQYLAAPWGHQNIFPHACCRCPPDSPQRSASLVLQNTCESRLTNSCIIDNHDGCKSATHATPSRDGDYFPVIRGVLHDSDPPPGTCESAVTSRLVVTRSMVSQGITPFIITTDAQSSGPDQKSCGGWVDGFSTTFYGLPKAGKQCHGEPYNPIIIAISSNHPTYSPPCS